MAIIMKGSRLPVKISGIFDKTHGTMKKELPVVSAISLILTVLKTPVIFIPYLKDWSRSGLGKAAISVIEASSEEVTVTVFNRYWKD